jgi:hexulose-6-phosphate isomerase
MKTSISLRCFPASMATAQRLALARDAGFDAVEVNLEPSEEFGPHSSSADLRRLRELVDEHGLDISAVYNRQQWFHPVNSLDATTRATGADIVRRLIDAARELRVDTVLVLPGVVDNGLFVDPPERVPYETAYRNAIAAMRTLGEGAAEAGVTLAVENVWNMFLLSPLEFRAFLAEIGSPFVRMYLDVGNIRRTGFPEDWIGLLGQWIHAVQVKDFRCAVDSKEGFVGLLQGDVNWPAVRQALESIGYDGWITGEVLPAYTHHPDRLVFETRAAIESIFDGYLPSIASQGTSERDNGEDLL